LSFRILHQWDQVLTEISTFQNLSKSIRGLFLKGKNRRTFHAAHPGREPGGQSHGCNGAITVSEALTALADDGLS
jgi:hypothetical protein